MKFWQRPPLWVWLNFGLAWFIFAASACTLEQGRRFPSRALKASEQKLIRDCLEVWQSWGEHKSLCQEVRALLAQQRLRAMDLPARARASERSAFGYSDEHGRILLNPQLCFLSLYCTGRANEGDLVATIATLIHEGQHHQHRASESQAYREEWLSVRSLRSWALAQERSELAQELRLWEVQMPQRMSKYAL